MLTLELLILFIGLVVLFLQNKIRYSSTETSRKIVYWTVMFFISLSFNTILFASYEQWYDIGTYLNINTLLIVVFVVLGYFLIQLLSPFHHLKNFIKKFSKDNNDNSLELEVDKASKESKHARQVHFEVFLETICWIGFISIFAFECYIKIFDNLSITNLTESNFILVLCLIIMLTLPITIRQILFYLINIRSIKQTPLSEEEINLQQKLRKNNFKL